MISNGSYDDMIDRATSIEKTALRIPVPPAFTGSDRVQDGTAATPAAPVVPGARPDTPTVADMPAVLSELGLRPDPAAPVAGESRLPLDLPAAAIARIPRRARSDRLARILRAVREEDLDGPLPDAPSPGAPADGDDPLFPARPAAA